MKYVISRYWHEPQIAVEVTGEGIGLSMLITDFIQALAAEMGNPALLLTQAGLLKRMQEAATAVQFKTQEATKQVI